MNGLRKHLVLSVALILLAACGKEGDKQPKNAETPAASTSEADKPLRGVADFGGTTTVSTEAEGVGSTLELATLSALQSAIAQVNGVSVAGQLNSLRAGLGVDVDGQRVGSIGADAFSQELVSASQGAVKSYQVLSQVEIDKVDAEAVSRIRASDEGYSYAESASASAEYKQHSSGNASASGGDARAEASSKYREDASFNGKANLEVERGASEFASDSSYKHMRSYWKVRVRADVVKYRAPDENGRPKVVVALPRVLSDRYPVGDSSVPSEVVASTIRARLTDTLAQTKRFIVLDREFGDEMQAEIDKINSGSVRAQDTARLGQQLATDLILIPTIERFAYPKSVRQLRMSDRQVVSYSGGGRIGLRLLNAATGEVVMSDSFDYQLPSTGPSTLPRVIDGKGMAETMMDSLSGQISTAIVTEIFPVSVVSLTGDQVVLSQGGDSLRVGEQWQAIALGEELKDPQTGNSLGRTEIPCCTIRIDRVASQMSYGTLVDGVAELGGATFRPGMIELRGKAAHSKPQAKSQKDPVAGTARKQPPSSKAKPVASDAGDSDPNW